MPRIFLETLINAPIERVFDLSLSIDLHQLSAKQTNEKAIAGKTSGLIGLNETVTWRAKHFGIYQKLTVQITKLERPFMFEDKMLKGTFSKMEHVHSFAKEGSGTMMTDVFVFESPLWIFGKMANALFLKNYMTKFLQTRNEEIKRIAEGEEWRKILS
jgi:ligand-binding SRPBCC domain-containing protein